MEHIANGHVTLDREIRIEKILQKEIPDIIMDNSKYVQEGVKMRYTCNPGFVLVGPTFTKCQASGTWQPLVSPSCEIPKFGVNRTVSSSMEYYPPMKTPTTQDFFQKGGE